MYQMTKRVMVDAKDLGYEGKPTPEISTRPVSMMHSWMDYLEQESSVEAFCHFVDAGNKPQWHAHNADRWAITLFVPDEKVYVIEGLNGTEEYRSRGLMFYVKPDAITKLPIEYRPKD